MGADGEEVLMPSSEKRLKDLRGTPGRLLRVGAFDREAYVHMLSYRALIPVSILYGLVMLLWSVAPSLAPAVKPLTVLVWLLFTPQLFETVRGLAMSWSRGLAFGRLNPEFASLYKERYSVNVAPQKAFVYGVMALWAVGFVLMLAWWSP